MPRNRDNKTAYSDTVHTVASRLETS